MRYIFLLKFLLLALLAAGQGSMNMTLFSNLNLPNLPQRFGATYNDIWGYTHSNGTEIAILGGIEDIFFIDVTSPADPQVIYTHHVENVTTGSTNQSLWRDFKTYQHYAYAAADEGTSGLLVFDLSQVPTSVTMVHQTDEFWNRAHNIFIDEPNGKLYAAGSSSVSNGLVILDLVADPSEPTLHANLPLNTYGGGYVHDVYVSDNIAYCSHGSLSKLQAYDVSDISNVEIIGTIDEYPEAGYNHSSWASPDGNWVVMADETHGSDLKLIDFSDPLNVSSDDIYTFFSELLGPNAPGSSIAHNPFILGDLVFISYYHDGVQVFDISDPNNIELAAYYDTYPDNTDYAGFEGCWGVYPYLASGNVIASDQTYGLYVMEVQTLSLPIDFLAFQAARQSGSVRLSWRVANAAGGNTFDVLRSEDGGVTFQSIGKVAQDDLRADYTYTDQQVSANRQYVYRIDFIQLDGRRISSPLRSVATESGETTIQIVNPVREELQLLVLAPIDDLEITWWDVSGKLLYTSVIGNPAALTTTSAPDLPSGTYLLSLRWAGGEMQSMIQKW